MLLHDEGNAAFAFAGGMHDLSFRLPPSLRDELLGAGRGAPSLIGPSWIDLAAFSAEPYLATCCAAAYRHVAERSGEGQAPGTVAGDR